MEQALDLESLASSLSQIINHLEMVSVNGRKIKSVCLNIDTREFNMEFEEWNQLDEESSRSLYSSYESRFKSDIEHYKDYYNKWKNQHYNDVTLEDLQEQKNRELNKILDCDFIIVERELINSSKLNHAQSLLQGLGLSDETHAMRLAVLNDLIPFCKERFDFSKREGIDRYLNNNHDRITEENIKKFFRFKTVTQLIYDDIDKLQLQKFPTTSLSESRQKIAIQLLSYIEKGNWILPATTEGIQSSLKKVLGIGENLKDEKDRSMSAQLWKMLEHGRGNRVMLTMQNLIGYFVSRTWLQKGSPALNKTFFGNEDGYQNIDKGNPQSSGISSSFKAILPLLDKFFVM